MQVTGSVSSAASYYLEKIELKRQQILDAKQDIVESSSKKDGLIDLNTQLSALVEIMKKDDNTDSEAVLEQIKSFVKQYTDVSEQIKQYAEQSHNKYSIGVLSGKMRNLVTDTVSENDIDKSLADIGISFSYDSSGQRVLSVDEEKVKENAAEIPAMLSSLSATVNDVMVDFAKEESSSVAQINKNTESKQKYVLKLETQLEQEMEKIESFLEQIDNQQNLLDQLSLLDASSTQTSGLL